MRTAEVDRVLAIRQTSSESYFPNGLAPASVMETASISSTVSSKSRAFLQVQQGCDHGCTFCIIP